MADDGRAPERAVSAPADSSHQVLTQDFFQALRRIESEARGLPRLGCSSDPGQEPVRLGQTPALAFLGSAIVSDERSADGNRRRRLTVSFFGLFGPNGPLPLHLSEYAYQRQQRHRDATLVRFADIFHHRLLLLLYRAWANAQPTVSADRPDDDPFARYIGALAGQHERAASEEERRVLGLARHFVGRTRHPEGLAKVLEDCFETPARIEEFVAEWLPIPDEYRWRLRSAPGAAALGMLGTSTRVGSEVLERQFKFRIVLGPMRQRSYERFLPGADAMPQLIGIVRRYLGHELAWDVSIILAEPEGVGFALGRTGRLGLTSHLGASAATGSQSTRTLVLDPLAQAS